MYGMAQLGVQCIKVEGAVEALRLPAMIFVDHSTAGPESHAVALVKRGDAMEIWDPLSGRVQLSPKALAEIWHGRAVHCAAPKAN